MNFEKILNLDEYTTKPTYDIESAKFTAVWLQAYSDKYDNLVRETTDYIYRGNLAETKGHIFILNYPLHEVNEIFIVPAPDCVEPSFTIIDGEIKILSHGYPIIRGMAEDSAKFCRDWYKTEYKTDGLHTMSNTWADFRDRNRVRADFLLKEIDAAVKLGIDVVQIDDGWQKGTTPPPQADDNSWLFGDGFWDLNKDAFPNGMEEIRDYAKEKGVKLGLWFAPQSFGPFEQFDRDIAILKKAYDAWGIRYFKLDFLQLWDKAKADKMAEFVKAVLNFGPDSNVELDVTADKRLGYVNSAPFGTIFVENRYTSWGNYYPHRTLRNLWKLSKYIPASKLQFEFMNTDLYRDSYNEDDSLRPELYDIDYLFASVMVSNPLYWMETQFLSDEKCKTLLPLTEKWKNFRNELTKADVYPIGDEPNGVSITGFAAVGDGYTHLILLRELCEDETITIDVPYDICELVHTNDTIDFNLIDGSLSITFDKQRTYVWLRLK